MKVLNKQLFSLQNGAIFAMVEISGVRGDRVNLKDEGLNGEVVFYCEAPKTAHNCVNYPEEGEIELGGAEFETERTLYLVVGPAEVTRDENNKTDFKERL